MLPQRKISGRLQVIAAGTYLGLFAGARLRSSPAQFALERSQPASLKAAMLALL